MMKRIAAMLLCCLLVLLCGCGDRNPPTPTPTPAVTEAPTPTPTLVPTATPEPTPTAVPTAAPLYTEQITYADQSIYDAPTYDGCFVGTVQQAGIYTIMEEVRDDEGNLWGRLKSGVGWVDLTEIRARREMPVPITANYADAALIAGGHYHHYVGEASDYAVQIAFRAHERLTDFVLCSMVFDEDMERGEDLYALAELTSDKPLVAELVFPGDMSSFGVTFTDGAGNLRSYMVFMSGRNGSIVFTEIAP